MRELVKSLVIVCILVSNVFAGKMLCDKIEQQDRKCLDTNNARNKLKCLNTINKEFEACLKNYSERKFTNEQLLHEARYGLELVKKQGIELLNLKAEHEHKGIKYNTLNESMNLLMRYEKRLSRNILRKLNDIRKKRLSAIIAGKNEISKLLKQFSKTDRESNYRLASVLRKSLKEKSINIQSTRSQLKAIVLEINSTSTYYGSKLTFLSEHGEVYKDLKQLFLNLETSKDKLIASATKFNKYIDSYQEIENKMLKVLSSSDEELLLIEKILLETEVASNETNSQGLVKQLESFSHLNKEIALCKSAPKVSRQELCSTLLDNESEILLKETAVISYIKTAALMHIPESRLFIDKKRYIELAAIHDHLDMRKVKND